jgi:hypothetical protein
MKSITKYSIFQLIQYADILRHDFIFNIAVILICCWSFGLSWIESTVNQDSHHWGLMYVPALDLRHGLIPHQGTLIFYGVLTSWIQSIGLSVFGENFKAIGITTGLFYSLSLWLSYRVFLRFLSRYSAFFAVLIIFLLHGYIIYPWSNYFFYTFELLAILFFIQANTYRNYLFSGFFVGLSILTRYSSIHVVLPPFIIFIFFRYFITAEKIGSSWKKLLAFLAGVLIPTLTFASYLAVHHGIDDLLLQNQLTLAAMGRRSIAENSINSIHNLIRFSTPNRDSRSFFFSFNFFFNLIALMYMSYHTLVKKKSLNYRENIVSFISLITLFGYLNSLHLYEIFRLINGSSLGIGVILFYLEIRLTRSGKKVKIFTLIPLIALCLVWANTLIFHQTSSVYGSWDFSTLSGKGVPQKEISIFRGKILSQVVSDYYSNIYKKLLPIASSYAIVNYTSDTTAVLITNRGRLQKSPAYFPAVQMGFPEEVKNIQQAIQEKKVIIFADKDLNLSGYRVILASHTPVVLQNFWIPPRFYISVPEEVAQHLPENSSGNRSGNRSDLP